MAGYDLPVRAIRQQVSSALDLIVHLSRVRDGSRRVTAISEVLRMEADVITLQDVFTFQQDEITADGKVMGRLAPAGLRPSFLEKFERYGVSLPRASSASRPSPSRQAAGDEDSAGSLALRLPDRVRARALTLPGSAIAGLSVSIDRDVAFPSRSLVVTLGRAPPHVSAASVTEGGGAVPAR